MTHNPSWEYVVFLSLQREAQNQLVYFGTIQPEASRELKAAFLALPAIERERVSMAPFANLA